MGLRVALALLFLTAFSAAAAQSLEEGRAWIHANGRACCPHDNCFPAPQAMLTERGWRVPGTTGVLPGPSGRPWPFEQTWACYYRHDAAKQLRCVFHPPPEGS